MAEPRRILSVKDLDPKKFFQTTDVSGNCLITLSGALLPDDVFLTSAGPVDGDCKRRLISVDDLDPTVFGPLSGSNPCIITIMGGEDSCLDHQLFDFPLDCELLNLSADVDSVFRREYLAFGNRHVADAIAPPTVAADWGLTHSTGQVPQFNFCTAEVLNGASADHMAIQPCGFEWIFAGINTKGEPEPRTSISDGTYPARTNATVTTTFESNLETNSIVANAEVWLAVGYIANVECSATSIEMRMRNTGSFLGEQWLYVWQDSEIGTFDTATHSAYFVYSPADAGILFDQSFTVNLDPGEVIGLVYGAYDAGANHGGQLQMNFNGSGWVPIETTTDIVNAGLIVNSSSFGTLSPLPPPQLLGLNPANGQNAIEIDRSGPNPCILSQWHYDETNSIWIESCDPHPPIATLNIPAGQLFDDVDINFGYIPHPDCVSPVQSNGIYTIYNNNDTPVASGTGQLAGTLNLDFSSFLTVPLSGTEYPADFNFRVEYFVEDNCGVSEIVEKFVIVEPYLKEVFTFTGADQQAQAPTWSSSVEIKAWGAGGGAGFGWNGTGGQTLLSKMGGAGGFVSGLIPITGGDSYTVVVGSGGILANGNTTTGCQPEGYGFGGGSCEIFGGGIGTGGGLTGFFTGNTVVLNTDSSRALIVAGGGGGAADFENNAPFNFNEGASGGSGSSGGQPNMSGITQVAANISAGGGGGFVGGSSHQLEQPAGRAGGRGGSNYIDPLAASTMNLFTPDFTSHVPPNISDIDYTSNVGEGGTNANVSNGTKTGGDGLVVITWTV